MPTKKFIELSGHERQTPTILPPSGHRNLYAKDDGWYEMDDAGIESKLTNEGGVSYLVYTALVTQNNTDAPVATVLENTLGEDVIWTRGSMGSYSGTISNPLFVNNKTIIPPFGASNNAIFLPIYNSVMADSYYSVYIASTTAISINTVDSDGTNIEWDNTPSKILVQIQIYP